MLLNDIISIKPPLIPLTRIFYKRIASGGLNHRLDEGDPSPYIIFKAI